MISRNFKFGNLDLDNKSILITGGTGSFGQAIVKKLLLQTRAERIIVYSRDEQKQFYMAQKYNPKEFPNIRYLIGDVRDFERLDLAMFGVDVVIHAAAMKHVEAAEYNPFECIRTNVNGAENIVRASLKNNITKVIALSTDKACNPINLYGASKLASDKIFIAANNLVGKRKTLFSVVRYGNVMGSNGSVLPLFKKLSDDGAKFFPITDLKMTRFLITIDQGTNFVLSSLNIMDGGEIFVPKIPSIKIIDLAKAIDSSLPLREVGIRSGEKLHEIMLSEEDAKFTYDMGEYYLLEPNMKFWESKIEKFNYIKRVMEGFSYNSLNNKEWLTSKNLLDLMEKNFD
jgi:UDP-N-acetylglucosamine 4,6-dehydratase